MTLSPLGPSQGPSTDRSVQAELVVIQSAIDDLCFDLYGINGPDRGGIANGYGADETSDGFAETDPDEDDANDVNKSVDEAAFAADLMSWAIGVAFGRFDVKLATGGRIVTSDPDPFDALPLCSPGMLTGEDGLPLPRVPSNYPLAFPQNGILIDDAGHDRDLTAAIRAVIDEVFGASSHVFWN